MSDPTNEANGSQDVPDTPDQHDPDQGGIVPPYMTRRLEAMRRYPVEDEDYPGVDRNAGPRQAFIEGAEWEAERSAGDT